MKSFKLFNSLKLLVFVSVILSLNACKKDDNNDKKDPEYVGTWSRTESIQIEDITIDLKDIMTLTKTTVSSLGQIYNPDTEEWLDLFGMKGIFTVNGKDLSVTVKQAGLSPFDDEGVPTGQIVYFNDTDAQFDAILLDMDLKQTFNAQYSVSGNQLTLKTDDNEDGDYNDDGETQVFTKETNM